MYAMSVIISNFNGAKYLPRFIKPLAPGAMTKCR
jgi:hypothetical protein